MDSKDLIGKEPFYFFPELLPFLRNDLLPGLDELSSYAENLRGDPGVLYGLTSRIQAMRDDLMNALAGVHSGETKTV
jgi:hypothetical protein